MTKYIINENLSKELALKYSKASIKKMCFKNVWELLLACYNKENVKIGYGYCKRIDCCYAVYHCFLIFNGKIIDTTLPENGNMYFVISEYSHEEYINLIKANNYYLDFKKLQEQQIEVIEELLKAGIIPLS